MKNPNEHSIFLKEKTDYEIEDIIKEFSINKANDIYGISTKIVKLGGTVISKVIALLFNESLNQGIFPNVLKLGKVIPIRKGDSLFEVSNYRPISLLPIISRIFEKLMYSRLITFLNKHHILYKLQFGFQKDMSTQFAVYNVLSNAIN